MGAMSRSKRVKKLLAVAAFPVLALLVWVVVADRTLAGGRTLHVVNGTPQQVVVAIGEAQVDVGPGQHAELTLAEGSYEAKITPSSGEPHTVPVVLDGSLVERFVDRTAFVLNVDPDHGIARGAVRHEGVQQRAHGSRIPCRL